MDERAIEAAGAAPLAAEFERIASIRDPGALPEAFAHLQSIGVAAPLSLGQMQDFTDSTQVIAVASQSGLGLPNRDYYLKSEPTFKAARAAYVEHVARMFALLGDSASDAARESKAVMALETRLADASMPDVEQRNPRAIYHPMTLARRSGVDPASRLAPVPRESGGSRGRRAQRRHAAFLGGGRPRAHAHAARGLEDLSSLATARCLRAVPVQGIRGRGLSHGFGAQRGAGNAAALAAGAACRGRGARICDRAALRRAEIPQRRARRGRRHGDAHPRCAAPGSRLARLDDARDAQGRAGEARSHAASDRLSGPLARLFRARRRPRPVRART